VPEAPLVGIANAKPKAGFDEFDIAEGLFAGEANHLQMVGGKLAAVTNGELALRLFAGLNHVLALLHRDFHRFFAEHVLAGAGGANGEFAMHGIGQHDIHDVDVGIIGDAVEVLVIIDVLARDIVLVGPDLLLGGSARDNTGEATLLCFLQSGRDLVGAQAAEADEGEAKPFISLSLCGRKERRSHWCSYSSRAQAERAPNELATCCFIVHKR
jgi:hypothetical protein